MVSSLEVSGVSTKTIEAFYAMWDNFPHSVMLLKRSREIVAANKKSKEKGTIEGRKCFQLGGLEDIHKGCLGNLALEQGTAQRRTYQDKTTGRVVDAYWLPVPTGEDLMLHFAVYIDPPTEDQRP